MKFKLPLFALLCTLSLTACKKDDPVPPYFPEGKVPGEALQFIGKEGLLPIKWVRTQYTETGGVKREYRNITEFKYDDKNRLVSQAITEQVYTEGGETDKTNRTSIEWRPTKREHRYVYHKNGYLIREEVTFDEHPERTVYYAYEGGQVYVKDHVYDLDFDDYFSKIEFDPQGRITRKVDPTGLHYQSFQYDATGNVSAYQNIIGGDSGWWLTHVYDDRTGIFTCCNTPQWYLATNGYHAYLVNNQTEENSRTEGPSRIEYEYNAQGYPVRYRYDEKHSFYTEEYTLEYIEANVF